MNKNRLEQQVSGTGKFDRIEKASFGTYEEADSAWDYISA